MDDRELDDMLASRGRSTSPQIDAAVAELVVAARAEAARASLRPRRRRWRVGGVALGAALVTAGGTLTAAQLDLPPFQGLEPGVQRVQQPIPVDYVIDTRKDVRCEAFLEYRNLTSDQMEAARTYVERRDWSSFGQRAYDTAKRTTTAATPDAVDRALGDVLDRELAEVARAAVPAASRTAGTDGPAVSGWSMACPTGQR
jgi:hypothetical protein